MNIFFERVRNLVKRVCQFFLVLPKIFSFYRGSFSLVYFKSLRVFYSEGPQGVWKRFRLLSRLMSENVDLLNLSCEYPFEYVLTEGYAPKISIIVPNYNHATHLKERLDSIYNQTYPHFEVILLDDCSTDNSVEILKDYASRYSDNTTCYFNTENSGGVFHQWRKGLELAQGELIWIAESDDTCSLNFLSELIPFFTNSAIMLAFARTEFITGDQSKVIWDQQAYLADLNCRNWNSPFVSPAYDLVRKGWAFKNLIPNVSATIFRKPFNLSLLDDATWLSLRMCGDWVFYLNMIRGGFVAYTNRATNYYRQHQDNTSVKARITDTYYIEHEYVAKQLLKLYSLKVEDLAKKEDILFNHWSLLRPYATKEEFSSLYSLERVASSINEISRRPNIGMVVYALVAGGGETFPIYLANALQDKGYVVTIFNFQGMPDEPGVRALVKPSIPIVNVTNIESIGVMLKDLDVNLIHSHHTWCDVNLATYISCTDHVTHVVTTHGMYDTMEAHQLKVILPKLRKEVAAFVYTAEKNLLSFPSDFKENKIFKRINNSLPHVDIEEITRESLGLAEEDFVLCMVARGIPEKGWEEAVQAVILANQNATTKRIKLLIIGSGGEYDRLKGRGVPPCIHLLGYKANIRDFFALSNVGLLPSRFRGESAPLVLIDCLQTGRPLIATAIADVPYMLSSDLGLAGLLLALENWEINVNKLAELILKLAEDEVTYNELLRRVPCAAKKFSFDHMVEQYELLYEAARRENSV